MERMGDAPGPSIPDARAGWGDRRRRCPWARGCGVLRGAVLPLVASGLALFGCVDPPEVAPGTVAEPTSPATTLPGTTEPPSATELLGLWSISWYESGREPYGGELRLSSYFFEDNTNEGFVEEEIIAAEGVDSCRLYKLHSGAGGTSEPAHAGEMIVTANGDLVFALDGPTSNDEDGTLFYGGTGITPHHGEAIGLETSGHGTIPALRFPVVGILPEKPLGLYSPAFGALLSQDEDVVLRWSGTGSGTVHFLLSATGSNAMCEVEDDGAWQIPPEILSAFVDVELDWNVQVFVTGLQGGPTRWIPVDHRFLQVSVRGHAPSTFYIESR